jgi:hypothetical protein
VLLSEESAAFEESIIRNKSVYNRCISLISVTITKSEGLSKAKRRKLKLTNPYFHLPPTP